MAKAEKPEKKKRFFKDFKAELKKVVWPTPKQVVNNTTAVITIVLITALIVFVLDVCFEALNRHGIDQIRAKVENTQVETTSDENAVSDDSTLESEESASDDTTEETAENKDAE